MVVAGSDTMPWLATASPATSVAASVRRTSPKPAALSGIAVSGSMVAGSRYSVPNGVGTPGVTEPARYTRPKPNAGPLSWNDTPTVRATSSTDTCTSWPQSMRQPASQPHSGNADARSAVLTRVASAAVGTPLSVGPARSAAMLEIDQEKPR